MESVYLDNAASTPLHPEVLESMLPYLSTNYGNPSSIHRFGKKNRAAIELARKQIAQHIGAKSSEIFFCSSGTEANNLSLKLAVENLGVKHIITTKLEHKCVLNTSLYLHEKHGIALSFVKTDALGRADLADLEQLLASHKEKTLISLMHIQNELGSINNLDEIAALSTRYSAYFHSDTVQSVAHYPIDVKQTAVDFLSASAHKFQGPLGVGFLYKKQGIQLGTWLHGGGHEKNLRSSTENVAGIVGMAKAMDIAYKNLEQDKAHIRALKTQLKEGLQVLSKHIVFNEDENSTYTILSVSFPAEMASDMLMIQLDMAGIAVSGGSACASGALKVSPVLEALNFPENTTSLRFSFSAMNTQEEIDYVIAFFEKIVH